MNHYQQSLQLQTNKKHHKFFSMNEQDRIDAAKQMNSWIRRRLEFLTTKSRDFSFLAKQYGEII